MRKDAASLKSKIDELDSKHSAELASTSARLKTLEDEKFKLMEELHKDGAMAVRLDESRGRRAAELASLKRQFEAVNALHETNVKKARKAAKREMAEKFQEWLAKVERNLEKLKEIKEKELDLAQVDNNLQLLDILKKDRASTLDSEVAKLTGWRAELAGAYEEFERTESELNSELKLSPISSDSVDLVLPTEPIENDATFIGVKDFDGSNESTPVADSLAADQIADSNLPA